MHQGTLFTREFLEEGVRKTPDWDAVSDDDLDAFKKRCRTLFENFPPGRKVEEANTELDLIHPVLKALGWSYSVQVKAAERGRSDVPDVLMFPDEEAKAKGDSEDKRENAYRHGAAITESKAWETVLDRRTKGQNADRVPSHQIVRYLSRVEIFSDGNIVWGFLTNGRHWRLYWQKARSVSEQYLELDLPSLVRADGFEDLLSADEDARRHWLKVFYLFFRREALEHRKDGRTFLDIAIDEGKLWEARIKENLSDLVFDDLFPTLITALYEHDPDRPEDADGPYLDELRDAALTLLYRLLFILYAEDRDLLPVRDEKYDDYGMRLKVREDIAARIDGRDSFSTSVAAYYRHMQDLFEAIEGGDASIGLPPYNGGLFRRERNSILGRARIPDDPFAFVIDKLSRIEEEGSRKWINFRDLSVQQLGSIYERLLEHEVVLTGGRPEIRPNIFARKGSGSYYTPEDLVELIIDRTLTPLIDEKRQAFEEKAAELAGDRRAKADRLKALREVDFPRAMLDLKVCDPAMGSGHFLVSLVDWLADRITIALDEVSTLVDWAEDDAPYLSPVAESVETIRAQILENAETQGWKVDEDQLEDKQIIRRMILKRVIYGVDKNSMAVELAKVSLWLHTFTVGAPLSFLDHHLRCGDSLFGEWVRPVEVELQERGALLINEHVQRARASAEGMQKIERLTDSDIAEVKKSAEEFESIEEATAPLAGFMSFMHALKWLEIKDKTAKSALGLFFDGQFGDPVGIANGTAEPDPIRDEEKYDAFTGVLTQVRTLVAEENFLHWQVAFPGVWRNWEGSEREGGFDAVIGNPPWDRIKMQEVEWFAARNPKIAHAQRAADRKKMIAALKKAGDPLIKDYEKARDRAEAQSRMARKGGDYPLLSGGDINLYSLFVERAQTLISPVGVTGLLTPSGIASDKTASRFFKSVSTNGRLAALLDFENKKAFFPDVDSRFKFCVFVAGGPKRKFDDADCAFFLHAGDDIEEKSFVLTPEDFAAVNPNTGTAPVFRTPRDAEITKAIYRRLPVLVDRRTDPPTKVWPVKYQTLFHMAGDSAEFLTSEELLEKGAYKISDARWKDTTTEYVPLYVGRMIYQFDHRAGSVKYIAENQLNRFVTEPVSTTEKRDSSFYPRPEFYIDQKKVKVSTAETSLACFRDIARTTDFRTAIATIIPRYGAAHTLPIVEFQTENPALPKCFFIANLNAFALDFILRQKSNTTHLT